ncbi:MAG: MFS transporter [Acidimicrobiales bacterium]
MTCTAKTAVPRALAAADPRRWRMLPVILSATFMALFDFFVVNVAAPSLQHDLHAGQAALELVVGGYAFTYAAGLVTGGRLGDLFGYRRLFLLGMACFALASLVCGLAQTPADLVVGRLAQGFTAAAMVPQVLALITARFPAAERPRALSWFGVAIGAGSVAGQVLGGLLLQADVLGLGWRAIFLVNVPVGAIAIGFALRLLPRTRGPVRPRLDTIGALGLSSALALGLAPLVLGRAEGWPAWTWVSMAASVPALAAVLAWERHLARAGGEPLLDLGLFRDRAFTSGLAINVAFMAFFGSFMLGLTLLLQSGLHLTPLQAGLTFGPLGLVFALTSVLGRPLAARYGVGVIALGAAATGLGLAGLLIELWLSGSATRASELIGPMALVGLGNGLALPSLIGAVLSGVRSSRAGAASGVLTTAQQFSSAAGVALLGVVFFAALGPRPDTAGYVAAMARVLVLDLALVATALGLTALLPRPSSSRLPLAARLRPPEELEEERGSPAA